MAFDDIYDDGRASFEELIAEGEYESNKELILAGFKTFQKKYVYKNVVIQMIIVVIALASQIIGILSAPAGQDVSFSFLMIVVCVVLGGYILFRPSNTYKKLRSSLSELEGCRYKTEVYTNKIVISTLYDPYIEEKDTEEKTDIENSEETKADSEKSEEDELPPATVIHLDNGAVEIVECSDKFLVYVKNVNVFVIPRDAFKPYDAGQIKDRLSNIMGVRYKAE